LANIKIFHIDDMLRHFNVYINRKNIEKSNELNDLPKNNDEIQLEWKNHNPKN
jgi:hypothetical protein